MLDPHDHQLVTGMPLDVQGEEYDDNQRSHLRPSGMIVLVRPEAGLIALAF